MAALGALLERFKKGDPTRGELREDQAVARGGVGEGFSTLSPWAKGIKGIKGLKGSKDSTTTLNAYDPKGRRIFSYLPVRSSEPIDSINLPYQST